ncbi:MULTISPECIES: 30S ribosomal protein S17 [Rubinisphaera]|uniref:Small ribosomal subunit protein uS17 n=1 Tax=Rubinisphaera italica TaxID=2527969 RepID=A0A5C5XIS8_9PLAN|nr:MULTISPECIES: 30S ribosomal protein S17 [Rubinisphaera]MBV11729.1 30S ribosomal protein S17 [Rubinisphaera sp.]TWT63086.1 30S ribosomal protein S17 [Rubinisphaera italica]HCS54590.1 30S ribosomal protein S17 [Planctomycetaceae bacterium]|tara:strand:- start:8812 stop:9111 length:300 start_codon:yes stop_codon:yes gene_type:complete
MKKKLIGIVASDKMNKTRRVEVKRLFQHPRYGKIVSRKTVCHVHDENNESKEGDKVEIIESRPLSRLKRWDLVRIVEVMTDPMAARIDDPVTAENVSDE